MSDKTIHIVFQIMNFIFSSQCTVTLPIDRLILIALAKHKGKMGIFPSQQTLANELHISTRHIRDRLKFLQSSGLISITRVGRKHFYDFLFLSTTEEPQFPYQNSIEEPQFLSQRNHSSANRGTTVPHINTDYQYRNKRERSLSIFEPDQGNILLAQDLRLDLKEELVSFNERHKGTKNQYEFSRWLKSSKEYRTKKGDLGSTNTMATREWGAGHPDYDRRHGLNGGTEHGMQVSRTNGRGNGHA